MEALYDELWVRQIYVIREFTVEVPYPHYGVRPGYRITLEKTSPLPDIVTRRIQQVFKMLVVSVDLPCGVRRLLVRDEYEDMQAMLHSKVVEKWATVGHDGRPSTFEHLDYKVSGQPGSGKSYFLSYLLAYRLLNHKPTVYRINDNCCFLFDKDTAGTKITLETLFGLSNEKKRDLWILTDEALTDANWNNRICAWFVVLAVSPAKVALSRSWEKNRNVGVHFTSTWTWDEIFAAYSLGIVEPPSQEAIEKLYTTYTCLSPVARTCLETINVRSDHAYNDSLHIYLGQVDREIEVFIGRGGRETVAHSVQEDCSHKIAIMDRTPNGLSYIARIITRWIAHRVYTKALQRSQQDCFLLYQHLIRQDSLRGAAGWFFEGYTHDWFGNGGTFTTDEIPVTDTDSPCFVFSIEMSKTHQRNYFASSANLASQVRVQGGHGIDKAIVGTYFLPLSSNNESFDGLVFTDIHTVVLFQITVAISHEIKPHGVKELVSAMPATIRNICIVFVVTEDRIGHYAKAQKIPDQAAVNPHGVNLRIRQFRLVFTNKEMQSVAMQESWKLSYHDDFNVDM